MFDRLISKLDVRSGQDTHNEIIYLKHAAAKDVATILSQLVSGQSNVARSAGQDVLRTINAANPAGPQPIQSGSAPGATAPLAPTASGNTVLSETGTYQFSSLVTILPEERSNAIVVSGTIDDIRLINDMIARIDVLPPGCFRALLAQPPSSNRRDCWAGWWRDPGQPTARVVRRPLPMRAVGAHRRARPDSSVGSIRMSVTRGPRQEAPSGRLADSPMPICTACPWLTAR